MKIGYPRVSTANQLLRMQEGALQSAGCEEIFTDVVSGTKAARTRGRMGGRPPMLDNRQVNRMVRLYNEGKSTVAEVCKIFNISRPSLHNYLKGQFKLKIN